MSKAPARKGDVIDLLNADHIAVKNLFDLSTSSPRLAPAEQQSAR
jgi:hypothetical protein